MKNKKGLSTIVATLMIILLTIVAFAIVATVITRNIKKDVGKIDLSSQCLDIKMKVTNVTNTTAQTSIIPSALSVTIEREAGGEKIDGYMLSITNSTSNNVIDKPGNFAPLKKATISVPVTESIFNVISASVTPYLKDSAGDKYNCPVSPVSQEFII